MKTIIDCFNEKNLDLNKHVISTNLKNICYFLDNFSLSVLFRKKCKKNDKANNIKKKENKIC